VRNALKYVPWKDYKAVTADLKRIYQCDDSATKVVYLAIQAASKKWTIPVRNWKEAMNHFMIVFEEQLAPHI